MDWACCGEIEEDDERRGGSLPATLNESIMAAMQEPHVMLNVSLRCEPWARRDALRRNCVRLLSRREFLVERKLEHDDLAPDARPPAPHGAALVSHALLEAIGRGKIDATLARMPKLVSDGTFEGSPQDILHTLRCASMPYSRACAMLRCACVATKPMGEFEFEVDYCARTSRVRTSADKLAASLVRRRPKIARVLLGGFDEKSAPRLGRIVARTLTKIHTDLAADGLFSNELVAALQLDVDRVWREEEPRIAALLDPPELREPLDVAYSIDADWIATWQRWIRWHPARTDSPTPPGPLRSAPASRGGILVSASLWAYFEAVHGKQSGLPRVACRRKAKRQSTTVPPSLPARPVALKIIQRAWRRSLAIVRRRSKRANVDDLVVLVPFGAEETSSFSSSSSGGRDNTSRASCHPTRACLPKRGGEGNGGLELVHWERKEAATPLEAATAALLQQ